MTSRRKEAFLYIAIAVLGLTAIVMILASQVEINVSDPGKPVFVYAPVPTPQLVVRTDVVTVTETITREVMVDGPAPEPAIVAESISVSEALLGATVQKPAAPPAAVVPTGDAGQKLEQSWPLVSPSEGLAWYEGGHKEILQVMVPNGGTFADLFASPALCAQGGCTDLEKTDPVDGCTVYAVPTSGWEPIRVSYCKGDWKISVAKGGIARF